MKTIAIAFKIYHSSAISTILSECETFSNQFHSFNALSHNTNSVCLCKALNLRVKCVFLSNKVFWTQFTRFFPLFMQSDFTSCCRNNVVYVVDLVFPSTNWLLLSFIHVFSIELLNTFPVEYRKIGGFLLRVRFCSRISQT